MLNVCVTLFVCVGYTGELGWRGRSGTVAVGCPPDASFGFYLREAFQSKTNTEKIARVVRHCCMN